MKKSLKKQRINNWKEHNAVSQLIIIDWEAYTREELTPIGCEGCCAYSTSEQPTLSDGSVAEGVKVDIRFDSNVISLGLKFKAWKAEKDSTSKQCDAIVFPATDEKNDAVLFIETKYSKKNEAWKDYKIKALKQITDTVNELRARGCPVDERNVYGLISFPLLNVVSASVFSPPELQALYIKSRIVLYTGNHVAFISQQSVNLELQNKS